MNRPPSRFPQFGTIFVFMLGLVWIIVGFLIDGGVNLVGRGFIIAGILFLIASLGSFAYHYLMKR